jgi:hypothetical protein
MVKSSKTLARGGKLKYQRILPLNFNPGKCRFCGKMPQYFYNIGLWACTIKHFLDIIDSLA